MVSNARPPKPQVLRGRRTDTFSHAVLGIPPFESSPHGGVQHRLRRGGISKTTSSRCAGAMLVRCLLRAVMHFGKTSRWVGWWSERRSPASPHGHWPAQFCAATAGCTGIGAWPFCGNGFTACRCGGHRADARRRSTGRRPSDTRQGTRDEGKRMRMPHLPLVAAWQHTHTHTQRLLRESRNTTVGLPSAVPSTYGDHIHDGGAEPHCIRTSRAPPATMTTLATTGLRHDRRHCNLNRRHHLSPLRLRDRRHHRELWQCELWQHRASRLRNNRTESGALGRHASEDASAGEALEAWQGNSTQCAAMGTPQHLNQLMRCLFGVPSPPARANPH